MAFFWEEMAALKRAFWVICLPCGRGRKSNLLLLGLLGEKDSLDVGEDTTLSDGDTREKLVQLLVIADGQLEVAGDDARLLVVAGGVASQLKDLGAQVLEDSGLVDGGTGANTLGVVALLQEAVDTANGELKSGAGRSGLLLDNLL